MLDDLSHTGRKLLIRKGLQRGNIRIDQLRHMKSADHVLVSVKINSGLPSDAGIHLRKKGGGNLNKGDPPQIRRGRKAA